MQFVQLLRFGLYADVIDSTVCTVSAVLYLFYVIGIQMGH